MLEKPYKVVLYKPTMVRKHPCKNYRKKTGCYSSKLKFEESIPCQKFTAIGSVLDDEPVISDTMENMNMAAYKRMVHYVLCHEVQIKPLINQLNFIQNKKKWGFPFRRGFFEISEEDYLTIENEMIEK